MDQRALNVPKCVIAAMTRMRGVGELRFVVADDATALRSLSLSDWWGGLGVAWCADYCFVAKELVLEHESVVEPVRGVAERRV
ncbi:hypothetical protein ERJ75_000399400 [Trypanosoma vivax]|nr:hypothetical protein ERJ75_000399400 [Trypanosoma vivax]